MDEIGALNLLSKLFNTKNDTVIKGIGDDCAVLKFESGKLVIATADSLVENVHFHTDKIAPADLGHKAVATAISDIAAMGGDPKFILSTIGLKNCSDETFLEKLLGGIKEACSLFKISLVGGNLSGSDTLYLDITVLGEIDKEHIVKRDGAKVGDEIYVTGTLGDSRLGLEHLKSDIQSGYFVNKHIRPNPKIDIAKSLATYKIPTSMIDISDGLFLDLSRIVSESNVGASVLLDNIPLSSDYVSTVKSFNSNKYEYAVTGGEDYELLFTANTGNKKKIEELSKKHNLKISCIGKINDSKTVEFLDKNNEVVSFNKKGYVHFNQ